MLSSAAMDERDAEFKKKMRLLAQFEEQVQLKEQLRVKKARQDFLTKHPPKMEECPICFESNIPIDNINGLSSFPCCGGYSCNECREKNQVENWTNGKCPLCRESFPPYAPGRQAQVDLRLAKMGRPLSQYNMGAAYHYGLWGLEKNHEEAFKWWNCAAKQGFRDSEYYLAMYYKEGEFVPKCLKTAREYLESAASRDHQGALLHLGLF